MFESEIATASPPTRGPGRWRGRARGRRRASPGTGPGPGDDLRFTSPMPQTRSFCFRRAAPRSRTGRRRQVGEPHEREERRVGAGGKRARELEAERHHEELEHAPQHRDDEAVGAPERAVHDARLRAVGHAAEEAVECKRPASASCTRSRRRGSPAAPRRGSRCRRRPHPRVDVTVAEKPDGEEATAPADHVGDPHAALGVAREQGTEVERLGQARAEDAAQLLLREAREPPQEQPLDSVPDPAQITVMIDKPTATRAIASRLSW